MGKLTSLRDRCIPDVSVCYVTRKVSRGRADGIQPDNNTKVRRDHEHGRAETRGIKRRGDAKRMAAGHEVKNIYTIVNSRDFNEKCPPAVLLQRALGGKYWR